MDQRGAFEARAKETMVKEEEPNEEDGDLDENASPDSDLHVVIRRERMLRMEWDAEKKRGEEAWTVSHRTQNVRHAWLRLATLLFPQPLPSHIQTKRWVHHAMLDNTFAISIDTNTDPTFSILTDLSRYHEWNPQVSARRDIVVSQAIFVRVKTRDVHPTVVVTHKDKQRTWRNVLFGHLFARCDHSFVMAPPRTRLTLLPSTAAAKTFKDRGINWIGETRTHEEWTGHGWTITRRFGERQCRGFNCLVSWIAWSPNLIVSTKL
jgi:hypothetical protein